MRVGWWVRPHFVDGEGWISLHKIEQMVDALGARLEDQRQEEITNTMVVCIDAGKAPTKGNERIDDDKRRRYDREFRDVKVASVSALEWDEGDQETHCSNSSYVLGGDEPAQPRSEHNRLEAERHDLDLGGSEAHAPDPRIPDELTLCTRLPARPELEELPAAA